MKANPDLITEVPAAFSQLTEYEHVVDSPSLRGELYTGPPETLQARTAIGALTGLVNAAYRAKEAATQALSWRDYRVGASAIMCNFDQGQIGYLDGYNIKPATGSDSLNLHAEQVAIAKGRLQGLNRVVGIAVFADPTDDDANPSGYETLRPCGRCVDMFESAEEVDARTLVLGTNIDFTKCELYTVGDLYDDTAKSDLAQFGTLALQTEADLEHYDREIKPYLVSSIYDLYQA